MAERVTVLVVDDQFLFGSSLGSVIKGIERYRLLGIAVTGPQALAMVGEQHPAIVLLDYHLPGYNADELLPQFRAVSPATRVIVLTSDTSEAALISSVRGGAVGFMTKDKAIDEVLDALATVADAGTLLTPKQLEIAGVAPTGRPVPPALPVPLRSPLTSAIRDESPRSIRIAAATGDDRASTTAPPASPDAPARSLELKVTGAPSFADMVLIERSIDRLPQVEDVYIRDMDDERTSLRVSLRPGATADRLAREALVRMRGLGIGRMDAHLLELRVEAPLVRG